MLTQTIDILTKLSRKYLELCISTSKYPTIIKLAKMSLNLIWLEIDYVALRCFDGR